MGRKSNIQKILEEQQKELERINAEEKVIRESAKIEIDKITKDNLFCGVVLGMEDILAILKLFITSNEPVKVEYQLYNIDKELENGTV